MKKLFRVIVEIEMVVAADTAAEAEHDAEYLVDVEDGGAEVCASATLLTSAKDLPRDWGTGTIPYGSEADMTIGRYLGLPSGGADT